jgi:hypothetical protein
VIPGLIAAALVAGLFGVEYGVRALWRRFGRRRDALGARPAREWLTLFGWKLADPSEASPAELDAVMDHDAFWEWCSGKIDFTKMAKP